MNTRKPTKYEAAHRETSDTRDALMMRSGGRPSPTAPDMTNRYPQADHCADNRVRQLDGQHEERNRMDAETGVELITVQVAANRLTVSRWMVYRLIWDQQVKSVQIGRCRRIVRQSFEDYLAGLIEGAA